MEKKIEKQHKSTIHGVARRKKSVARVWLKKGKGSILINDRELENYFPTSAAQAIARKSFEVSGKGGEFDTRVNVNGGGRSGQAAAVKVGIARALLNYDAELRPLLKENGLLTIDARVKERKKYGQKGARAKFQFVKR